MSEAPKQDTPVRGTVNFVQHNLPGLDAGAYQIKVSHHLSTQPGTPIENIYHFAVKGERFALNPQDIFATFPPDQAEGEFGNTLPHVVLTKQTLPWIRYPTKTEPARTKNDYDLDVPTWLAVLLFDDDDMHDSGFALQPVSKKVRDLFATTDETGKRKVYSYFYDQNLGSTNDPDLAKHLGYGELLDDPCQVLDIPLKLFWEVAPSVDDLKLTAHIRHTEITKKATQNGMPTSRTDLSNIPGTSFFAAVFGNRLPATGRHSVACLVSLEGMEDFLPVDPATPGTPDKSLKTLTIDPKGLVRLVCLKRWSFTSIGDGRHFEKLLNDLLSKNPSGHDVSIRLPPAQGDGDQLPVKVKNALAMGYTALQHDTRDGGQTVSWYRGPLLPYQVNAVTTPSMFTSADAATCYDPATGMFDLSYAAAWQLGRLLALQDKHFSVALYNWRRGNLRDVVSQMELAHTQASLDTIETTLGKGPLLSALQAFLPGAPNGKVNGSANSGAPNGKVNGSANLTQRAELAQADRDALTDPDKLALLMKDQVVVPATISSWLARLKLLDGIPFTYLVPDERMLPPESIRFFHVDMNWAHALLDGAFSIGRHVTTQGNTIEHAHDQVVVEDVINAATCDALKLRAEALGIDPSVTAGSLETMSGFLLRSEVVKGWPGLEVDGYAEAHPSKDAVPLEIVRFERLAPTVLLCLFDTTGKSLHHVDIHEPPEGLHFGLADAKGVAVRYNYKVDDDYGTGTPAKDSKSQPVSQPVPFRQDSADRLIRMFRLAQDLLQNKDYIHGISGDLPSSEFALQMIKGVGKVSFILSGGSS